MGEQFFEAHSTLRRSRLDCLEKGIRQFNRRLHMGKRMGVWGTVNERAS